MKPTKTSTQPKTTLLRKLQSQFLNSELYFKAAVTLLILVAASLLIWFVAPGFPFHGYNPFLHPEKRFYVIVALFLIWLLKFLMIDLADPLLGFRDKLVQERLAALQSRFRGAVQFLKKTVIAHQNKSLRLSQLPWFLLIGPMGAGKTSLLANAKIHFILQRQFPNHDLDQLPPSENCDWWITRDASIVDVPGYYLCLQDAKNTAIKKIRSPILWRAFLRLIRKQRGKHGLDGIIIALPLPELLSDSEPKKYYAMLRNLFQRIYEVQQAFPTLLNCHIVITKCDLLPGFKEFFSEFGNDELAQAWGVTLSEAAPGEQSYDHFVNKFNLLIKKLNQQLLWRLHQERNPFVRPYIKDFPLQVERVKEFVADFVKRLLAARFQLRLAGVYLMSATQEEQAETAGIIDENIMMGNASSERALQIFQAPKTAVRSYFIKQFLTHGIINKPKQSPTQRKTVNLKRRFAYASAIAIIGSAAFILGRDFKEGIQQAYSVQQDISAYRLKMHKIRDPQQQLLQTVALLDHLQAISNHKQVKFDLNYILSFYSHQSQQRTYLVYRQALNQILIPEIKNYFEHYLNRSNKISEENIYAALKAYLMLGDQKYFEVDTALRSVSNILSDISDQTLTARLLEHLKFAFSSNWQPIALQTDVIQRTRKVLTALPNLQLSYVILKNINHNNSLVKVDLGLDSDQPKTLVSNKAIQQIPMMFTVDAFKNIMSDEITIAAKEATNGNWIIGDSVLSDNNQTIALAEQLRSTYITNYIETWENIVNNIQLSGTKSLADLDQQLVELVSTHSPLLTLLHTLKDQTYFEPIVSSSPKLQNLGLLWDQSANAPLYRIINSLQNLHISIQTILKAENPKKAAFDLVSHRMLSQSTPDALMQLRLTADQSPDPIKTWLNKIANDTWHVMMNDAGRYIDTSWQEKVNNVYQAEIANRYPFSANSKQEVDLKKFVAFFGNPGIITNFFNEYLQAFVDNNNPDWRWRTLEDEQLPFSNETLRHLRQALQIHRVFFPKLDNQLNVQFALQPYQFGKQIKSVKLNINDKEIIDQRGGARHPHIVVWPSEGRFKNTSIQLVLDKSPTTNELIVLKRDFPGDWGWFKLVNQSFESIITKKELLLNLSANEHPAKYLLFTPGQFNPFLSLNLKHFYLPPTLSQQKV